MTWLSFSDDYTGRPVWDGVPYEARWLHHCIVERAAATGRYDGILPRSLALRCSDVPDPEQSLKDLVKVSLIIDWGSEVEAVEIEGFLPPERSRPENLLPRKRANTAEYRRKKCARGDHDRHCPSATCPAKMAVHNLAANEAVTGRVTGNPGSGRVGAGGETTYKPHREEGRTTRARLRHKRVA